MEQTLREQPTIAQHEYQPDPVVTLFDSVFVKAPANRCFDLVARQLERTPHWDPMISDVRPAFARASQMYAASHITFKLGKKETTNFARICKYVPDRVLEWFSSYGPRPRECWELEPSPHGTMVRFTLSYEEPRWPLAKFLDRLTRRKQVKRDIRQMLKQLKEVAEGGNGDTSS